MKIKIGSLTYAVVPMLPEVANATGIYGKINHQAQKIWIQSDISDERAKEVLLHELIHGCFHQWVPDNSPQWTEESITSAIGYGLSTIFKDNPKLKEMLFDAR